MKPFMRRSLALAGAAMLMLTGCSGPEAPGASSEPEEADIWEGSQAALTVQLDSGKEISDNLYGLFLEDINYAVDAGLYAELIKNRSFEYGELAVNQNKHGWGVTDSANVTLQIIDGSADQTWLHENNPHYARLTNAGTQMQGIGNSGYLEGLAVTAGESYIASVFAWGNAEMTLSLEDTYGNVLASAPVRVDAQQWTKYTVTLTPSQTVSKNLRFLVRIGTGSVQLDMISLMPEDTFAGLPIRKDIGEALRALNPSFLRFPGGCAIEGKTEESMYNWKDSIGNGLPFTVNGENAVGDVAARVQTQDLWHNNSSHPYYCTYGLGFYEYFLLCEALDCFPVPIVNAGMTCPIQSTNYKVYPIDSAEFRQCVQDALDLVEFCRGGADTTWGAVRIAMGHPEPFALPYLGIGNEQWQSEYYSHYSYFVNAFRQAALEKPEIYADVQLIVANGPVSGNTEGWSYIKRNPDELTALVDEHYYESAEWFLTNTNRYDSYSRSAGAKVFLGEYASKTNTMLSALAEAAFMTGLERNGDVVELACYAPLFGNAHLNQWLPDMIFFSNASLYKTPNYYVQQLFAANAGSRYLDTQLTYTQGTEAAALSGGVGLGSWMTSVAYDALQVTDSQGNVLLSDDFSDASGLYERYRVHKGSWKIENGWLMQLNTGSPSDTNTGDVLYVGDGDWSNYTLTVQAKILGGSEGFLIPVCAGDPDNNIFWNLGGWGNTVSCLQIVSGGAKSDQVAGTVKKVKLNQGQTYTLKIEVSGRNIRCYLDGKLYVDYTKPVYTPVHASTVVAENGDVIVKLVNAGEERLPVELSIPGLTQLCSTQAQVTVLKAESGSSVNSFAQPEQIVPQSSSITLSDSFTYTAEPWSLTVIRIPAK